MIEGLYRSASDGAPLFHRVREARGACRGRLVLVHSLGLDATLWNGVLAQLPDSLAVAAYDCRGHGRSAGAGIPGRLDTLAADLVYLLDHLAWPQAAIAGCSLGGVIALRAAALHPQRCAALALIDTTAWYGTDGARLWAQRAADAQRDGLTALGPVMIERWLSPAWRAAHREEAARLLAVFAATPVQHYAAACQLLGAVDLRPQLPSLRMPVEVIVGADDGATPPAWSQQLAASLASARLTILEACRHLSPVEQPAEVAQILERLFEGA